MVARMSEQAGLDAVALGTPVQQIKLGLWGMVHYNCMAKKKKKKKKKEKTDAWLRRAGPGIANPNGQ